MIIGHNWALTECKVIHMTSLLVWGRLNIAGTSGFGALTPEQKRAEIWPAGH